MMFTVSDLRNVNSLVKDAQADFPSQILQCELSSAQDLQRARMV